MEPLPLYGGFSLLNALRPINKGEMKGIKIQFEPHTQQIFEEKLKIFSNTSSISLHLKGKGVRPEVQLLPESGLLPFGGVLLGDVVERTFTVKCLSNFKIHFKLKSLAKGVDNRAGYSPFSFIPSDADVEPGKEVVVKVTFRPDRISEKFYEFLSINVPNQIKEKRIYIVGSCYPRSAFVTLHRPLVFPTRAEDLIARHETSFELIKVRDEDLIYSPANNRIVLEFQKPHNSEDRSEACFTRRIVIGNCKLNDVKAEKPTAFEITMPREEKGQFFTCDKLKEAVAPGSETVITFTYKPSQPDPFIANIKETKDIGQWIEVKADLRLSGGFVKPGVADAAQFDIILRAYLNQI
eukprot:TRINITY_DN13124_c0_g1_i2.p1 TRINITY_DN13124_c0_g1~~TRINITY_DN13124_c0_g1_i2.p1  ORF type:complete len:352 (-),score=62.77 TRINITY_DN13124_c0_g1_i2:3-1058(-)